MATGRRVALVLCFLALLLEFGAWDDFYKMSRVFSANHRSTRDRDVESSDNPTPEESKIEQCFQESSSIIQLKMTRNRKYLSVCRFDSDQETTKDQGSRGRLRVHLWNMENVHPTQEAEEILESVRGVYSCSFDEADKIFYVADADPARSLDVTGVIRPNIRALIPGEKKQYLSILGEGFRESRIRLSPQARWIACCDDRGMWRLVDRLEPARVVYFPELEIANKKVYVTELLSFSPNLEFVATLVSDVEPGNESRGDYRTIVIWDLLVAGSIPLKDVRNRLETFEVSRIRVADGVEWRRCVFSNDGKMIAVRSKSKYIGVWQTADGRLLSELGEHRQNITSISFSPNNLKLLVGTGGEVGRLILWDIRKELIDRVYQVEDSSITKITAVTFSPDGNRIYFGTDTGGVFQWILR